MHIGCLGKINSYRSDPDTLTTPHLTITQNAYIIDSMSTVAENVTPTAPLAEIMRALTNELPLNDFGLPTGIYRSDLLPFHLYDPTPSRGPREATEESSNLLPVIDEQQQAASITAESRDSLESPEIDEQTPPESSVDPFSVLSGQGDGLPDMMMKERVRVVKPSQAVVPVGEYRIAGFPANALNGAFVPLQYDEGFPAFEDGTAFWSRLPFEPQDAHLAFERYMLMASGRAPGTENSEDVGMAADGIRSIGTLITKLSPDIDDVKLLAFSDKLTEYYHLYYWGLRVRSYDLFRVTQHHQQQELRAIETQDDHYIKSRKLRTRLEEYMDDDEDFWDMMTPKTALDMHKHLTQLERISAGVPASGPITKDDNQQGQSFEMTFATVAQAHRNEGSESSLLNEDGEVLEQALKDPAAVEILQKLIIKTGGG